jgi:hypothetical protein
LHGGFRAVVPENREAVRIQGMLGNLFCVVIIEGIIYAQRLKCIEQREEQREEKQGFQRSMA